MATLNPEARETACYVDAICQYGFALHPEDILVVDSAIKSYDKFERDYVKKYPMAQLTGQVPFEIRERRPDPKLKPCIRDRVYQRMLAGNKDEESASDLVRKKKKVSFELDEKAGVSLDLVPEKPVNRPKYDYKRLPRALTRGTYCYLCKSDKHNYRSCTRKDAANWRIISLAHLKKLPAESGTVIKIKEEAYLYDIRSWYFDRSAGQLLDRKNETVLHNKPLFSPDHFAEGLAHIRGARREDLGMGANVGNYFVTARHCVLGEDPSVETEALVPAQLPQNVKDWCDLNDIALFYRVRGLPTFGKPSSSWDVGDTIFIGRLDDEEVYFLQSGEMLPSHVDAEFHHTATSVPGFSGTPVYHYESGHVIGVHTRAGDNKTFNRCRVFTEEFVKFLNSSVLPKKGKKEKAPSEN